jgi:hypothetical protein
MTNRLPYETKAGHFSEAETFLQLIEYLRMAQECCLALGHYRKAQDDELLGKGWLGVGEMLHLMQDQVTSLATKRIHKSTGWRQ